MKKSNSPVIYTIGHSTRTIEDFVSLLQTFSIKTLADIRHFPGSRKFPQFNKEQLAETLKSNGIEYIHLVNLGGRRKVKKDSKNTRWRNEAFRGYADYMETEEFEQAINKLQDIARKATTAFMCSEAVWWRCHRSMVSDYLKAKGWKVLHIMTMRKIEEHPYTTPARIAGGRVLYSDEDLFTQRE